MILSGPSASRSTWIRSTQPTVAQAEAPYPNNVIWWDGNSVDESNRDYVLLWFDLSGIPANRFQAATLQYVIGGDGNSPGDMGELHNLLVPWSMNTSYSSLPYVPSNFTGGSSSTYGAADQNMPCMIGPHSVDVTDNVREWLSGTPNYGWIVVPTFANGCGMQSNLSPTNAPKLVVSVVIALQPPPLLPPPPFDSFPSFTYAFNGENSSYTGGCQSTWIRSDTPDFIGAQDTGLWWDGSSSVGNYDSVLVQFPNIVGLGPNQLRPHEYIQRATLRYYVDETFSANARGSSAQLHEISKEWSANSTTFRTFAGAQGLNEDEYRTPAIATAFANPRAGWYEIDVTASVRSWVTGVGNNGWIWMPSPQALGGSGDGSSMRACSAPPDRRVNLVVLAALQPPRPPSPPARPPPPPPRPSPPPSPPHAPFTVLQIRNAQHARLRMVAPDANYVNDVGVFWDGNSACARQRRTKPARHGVGSATSAAALNGLIPTFRFCAHTRLPLLPWPCCCPQDRCRLRADEIRPERALGHGPHLPRALPLHRV
jgi:hypothetical protein